jgi:excisionase family DNA binding protein
MLKINNQKPEERRYLTVDELSTYLGISTSTIYKKVHFNTIPFLKMGRLTRFDRIEIDEWIRGGYPLLELPTLPEL